MIKKNNILKGLSLLEKCLKSVKNIFIKNYFWFLFFIAIIFWIYMAFFGKKIYYDEGHHYRQIKMFYNKDFSLNPKLTTIPTYHAIMAFIVSPTDDLSMRKVRVTTLLFSLVCIFVFYKIIKIYKLENVHLRTLQFIYFPISFLYFPLIYTDIFSLLFFLLAFYFILKRRYFLVFIASSVLIGIRQNNIIWYLFIWFFGYLELFGTSFVIKNLIDYFKKTWFLIFGIIGFLTFIYLNGGIAIGDKKFHQAGFYLGNIYFFLFICGIVFLPKVINSLKAIKINKKILISILISIFLSLSFFLLMPKLHPYNEDVRFIRNIILTYTYQINAIPYAIIIFIGSLFLFITKTRFNLLLIIPFISAYLAPSWMVEQRYLIIPLIIMIIHKKEDDKGSEMITLFYYMALSIFLFSMAMGFFGNRYFF